MTYWSVDAVVSMLLAVEIICGSTLAAGLTDGVTTEIFGAAVVLSVVGRVTDASVG